LACHDRALVIATLISWVHRVVIPLRSNTNLCFELFEVFLTR